MGAAKRVEAEKRRQHIEDGMFAPTTGPDLAPPPSMTKDGLDPSIVAAAQQTVYGVQPQEGLHADNDQSRRGPLPQWPDLGPAPQAAPDFVPPYAPTPGPFRGTIAPDQVFKDIPNVEPHPARARGVQRLQEMSQRVPQGATGFAPQFDAVNNNTHPEARMQERAVVNAPMMAPMPPVGSNFAMGPQSQPQAFASAPIQPPPSTSVAPSVAELFMPQQAPVAAPERTIEVEARRETITYRVPISEAALPQSLTPMFEAARSASLPQSQGSLPDTIFIAAQPLAIEETAVAPVAQAIEPLPLPEVVAAAEPVLPEAEIEILPLETEELDEATRRLVGKLGPAGSQG
jgi:hypothetical protein